MYIISRTCYLLVSSVFLLISCIPVEKQKNDSAIIDLQSVSINLQDSTIRSILVAQNDQDPAKIFPYFTNENASARYAAALALGSIKNKTVADTLAFLLNDVNVYVAAAAAYSLGLLGTPESQSRLLGAFRQYDTSGINSPVNGAILEAIGRLGTVDFLQAMATVETYQPTDTLLLLGQIRGIYRYMLRGITDATGTNAALKYLTNPQYPQEVRLIAAHYFVRAKNLDLSAQDQILRETFTKETNADIQVALLLAIGKLKSETAYTLLNETLVGSGKEELQIAAIKGLRNFEYAKVKSVMIQALKHPSLHVARESVSYLQEYGRESDANEYRNIARENLPWQVKLPLLGIANKNMSYAYAITKGNVNAELKSSLSRTDNINEKIACIQALAMDPKNINFLLDLAKQSGLPAIHSAVMDAGIDILKNKFFTAAFGTGDQVKKQIAGYLKENLLKADDAALEIIESAVKDSDTDVKNLMTVADLEQIKSSTSGSAYAQHMLSKSIATLNGSAATIPSMNNYKKLSNADFALSGIKNFAEISTDKGTIKLRLLPQVAPASVANFARLVQSEFYNGKNFHRVVPGFVIQGGCPRGDGYGGMDYSIRSEVPPVYYNKPGLVGLASAGPHTESCQFFITHTATPHLDGNYTIFAEVVSGMEVVNAIQIGDKIQRINLTE